MFEEFGPEAAQALRAQRIDDIIYDDIMPPPPIFTIRDNEVHMQMDNEDILLERIDEMYNDTITAHNHTYTINNDMWSYATAKVCRSVDIIDLYNKKQQLMYDNELRIKNTDHGVFLCGEEGQEIKIFDESGLGHRLNSLRETVNAMQESDPIKTLVKRELIKIMIECGLE